MKLVSLLLSLPLLASCAAEPEGPLHVASDLDNPPFAWVDEDGAPRGRDVEMMERIADELGRELEWRRLPFDELLPAVERGQVDVVCATLGYTAERARRVLFSEPYFVTTLAIVVRDERGAPRTPAELAGRRVVAATGTTSERAVRALPAAIGVFPGKTADAESPTTLERLLTGDVDAAVMDGPAADAMVRDHPGRLVRLGESLGQELYSLACPPGREALVRAIDVVLGRIAGELRALDERYELSPSSR